MVKVLDVSGRWEQSVTSVYGGGFSGCFAAVIAHNGTAISINNRYFKLTEDLPMHEISYTLVGDYYLPNIALSDPPDAPPLGRYGMLHKRYLKEHRPILYSQLLLSERLYPICHDYSADIVIPYTLEKRA
ncbi:hypothetical protein FACS1894202_09900 [Clostridia bacterium]|nr:hypothetical protein FACS1894202_09900 [Clostridia bacterium]